MDVTVNMVWLIRHLVNSNSLWISHSVHLFHFRTNALSKLFCSLVVITCNQLEDPEHGVFTCKHPIQDFGFNSSCDVQCKEGYKPTEIMESITCTDSGKWSAPSPSCKGMTVETKWKPKRNYLSLCYWIIMLWVISVSQIGKFITLNYILFYLLLCVTYYSPKLQP